MQLCYGGQILALASEASPLCPPIGRIRSDKETRAQQRAAGTKKTALFDIVKNEHRRMG
jgi:hypothetical protein